VNFGQLIRREWGAVTFVVTVLVGLIIVPIAFLFLNKGPAPVNLPEASPSPTVSVSASPSASPSPSPSASPSASPTP
jgi:biopolymer transport protein ExbD